MPALRVAVVGEPIDVGAEIAAIGEGRTDIGAVVSFTGLCRDEDGRLAALELEHYPGMAEAEIRRIAETAASRWAIEALSVIHRHGLVRPGEVIVAVVAASRHRRAAFEAAAFLMDFLKTRAPFWKREILADGSSSGWVEAKQTDNDAEARWKPAS